MLAIEITTALIQSQGLQCKDETILAIVQMGAAPEHIFN